MATPVGLELLEEMLLLGDISKGSTPGKAHAKFLETSTSFLLHKVRGFQSFHSDDISNTDTMKPNMS